MVFTTDWRTIYPKYTLYALYTPYQQGVCMYGLPPETCLNHTLPGSIPESRASPPTLVGKSPAYLLPPHAGDSESGEAAKAGREGTRVEGRASTPSA